MDKLKEKSYELLARQHFDSLAVGVLDFKTGDFQSFTYFERKPYEGKIFFDLASLTKPFTLASTYLKNPKFFSDKELLLLEHRGGLPAWARLSSDSWQEFVMQYEISESEVLYSDLGALRLQLELEKKSGKNLRSLCSYFWDEEIYFWQDLPKGAVCPSTGFRSGKEIRGEVHDDNAYNLNTFAGHAGLFGTVEGCLKSLLSLEKETGLLKVMNDYLESLDDRRFALGWDRAQGESSLAGVGASAKTFGHLGFTGTSIWIDPVTGLGHVILTNSSQNYWFDRTGLNDLRRTLGALAWKASF